MASGLSDLAKFGTAVFERDMCTIEMAEGLGFEPRVLAHNGFQDRPIRPLWHPSEIEATGVRWARRRK